MYSTHFYRNTSCMDMSFYNLIYSPRRGGSRGESVPVSSGVSPFKELNQNQNLQAIQQSNIRYVSILGCISVLSKMAILLTQENMFHHE